MKNFTQPGHIVTVPAPANVEAGDLVMVGTLFGVAVTKAASGAPVEINTQGVYVLPKTSAQAWTVGVAIYWDAGNSVCTTTASSNVKLGNALLVADNPSDYGTVRLSI